MKTKIILASASPRRREILKKLGYKFRVVPGRTEESIGRRFSQKKIKDLALKKAISVAGKLKEGIVIGADTVVVLKGRIYGKPAGVKGAEKMLGELSGTAQDVWTAVALVDAATGRSAVRAVRSRVVMKKLLPGDIKALAKKNLDKAGAYAAQEDDRFIKSIKGSFSNVVGFPIEAFKSMLGKFGIKRLESKSHRVRESK